MRYCTACDLSHTNPTCPRCGRRNPSRRPAAPDGRPDLHRPDTFVSDPDDRLDDMIEQASRPTLASLVKAGLKRGLITVVPDYAQRRNTSK